MSSTVFMIVGRRSRGIVVIVVMVLMVASLESSRVESVSISLSRTQVFPRPAGHQKKSKRHQKCRSVGRSVECSRPNLYVRFRAASTNYNRHEEVLKRHPPRASQRSVPYRWNPARRLHPPSLPPPRHPPSLSPLSCSSSSSSSSSFRSPRLWVCALLAWPRCAPSPCAPFTISHPHHAHGVGKD